MKFTVLLASLLLCGLAHGQSAHHCAPDAAKQAKKLLGFHYGEEVPMDITKQVKTMAPLRNPAGKGSFDVLEVTGYIQKATYRMHFIYGQIPGDCVLVGQEIIEITNL